MQEEEQTTYTVDDVSDQWSDCGVSVWSDSESPPEEIQDKNSSHSNPFTYDGAQPEETQDENSSHSNHQNNDGVEPEDTQDEKSSHSNPFIDDGAQPEETQDENSSHSNPQNNDGARPGAEEAQDESSSHSNPFTYDGARLACVTKRKNVILFGETGVGKSSIINLMADADVAATSSGAEACTLLATEYSFTLSGKTPLCIFDTVGLNEPEISIDTFLGAIEEAYRLITSLHDSGGIDLLLFCIRGGRFTTTMQRNYRLFFEFLCGKKVPLAFIVTHLENEGVMEDWWARNEKTLEKYGIHSVAHACITAGPAQATKLAEKRAESRIALQRMLHDALSFPSAPYVQDVWSWFTSVVDMIWSFLMKRLPVSVRRRYLSNRLRTRCGFSPDEAQRLADMLTRQ